jgi:protein ImuA
MALEKLAALRSLLGGPASKEVPARVALGHAAADLCLKGGLQRGALHEVFAAAGHEAAAAGFTAGMTARAAAGKHVLWLDQNYSAAEFGSLSATGLLEFGIDPHQVLLFRSTNAEDELRAANDALSCMALGAVVIEIPGNPGILDLVASRRLTLAALQKSITVFLLQLGAEPETSAAETRWLLRAAVPEAPDEAWGPPLFEACLVRNRSGQTGSWLVEWNCDARCFQVPAPHCRPVVSAASR